MSDLVGNPEDRFSHNEAHISSCCLDLDFVRIVLSLLIVSHCERSLSFQLLFRHFIKLENLQSGWVSFVRDFVASLRIKNSKNSFQCTMPLDKGLISYANNKGTDFVVRCPCSILP